MVSLHLFCIESAVFFAICFVFCWHEKLVLQKQSFSLNSGNITIFSEDGC